MPLSVTRYFKLKSLSIYDIRYFSATLQYILLQLNILPVYLKSQMFNNYYALVERNNNINYYNEQQTHDSVVRKLPIHNAV